MPPFRTEAIIIRSSDFQERDRLITFYGDERGKMRGVARGAKRSRKRFGSNLDLLAHVWIHGFERPNQELVQVDGADLVEGFGEIRAELGTFARACYLAEWVDGCTVPHQPMPGLLPLVLRVLGGLRAGEGGEGLLRIFELKLLTLAGYGPRLDRCVACNAGLAGMDRILVHVGYGGALCSRCAKGVPTGFWVSQGTLRSMEEASMAELDRLHRIAFSRQAIEESRSLLRSFYSYHVGRSLKTVSFLESVRGPRHDVDH